MISSVSTTIWNHKALSHFYGHFVVSKSGKCLVEQDFICSLPSYGNILGMHLIKENQTFYGAFLCVKSAQIWSFLWSVFSRFRIEYGDLRSPKRGTYGPEKIPYLDMFRAVFRGYRSWTLTWNGLRSYCHLQ